MTKHQTAHAALVAVIALGLTACSGGGGGSAAPHPASTPGQFEQMATIVYGVVAPMPGSSSSSATIRRPKYLSPNTGSVSFNLIEYNSTPVSQPPVVVNLTTGCTPNTPVAGEETCTTTSTAPAGTDEFAVTTYQSTTGTGTPLSESDVTQAITVAGPNDISVTLNPVVATIAFNPTNSAVIDGSAASGPLVLSVKDASGATIVGAAPFVTTSGADDTITVACGTHLTVEQSNGTAAATSITSAASNTIAKAAYDGTSLGASGGTVACTATDTSSTPLTTTFTLTTSTSGAINWTLQ